MPLVFVNLTATLFVDADTTVPAPDRTGNIEAPLSTIGAGITSLPSSGGALLIVPQDYSAEPVIDVNGAIYVFENVQGVSMSPTGGTAAPLVSLPVITGTADLVTRGCVLSSVDGRVLEMSGGAVGGAAVVTLTGTFQAENAAIFGEVNLVGSGTVLALSNCVCAFAAAFNLSVATSTSLTDVDIQNAVVVTFNAPGGVLRMDAVTYQAFLASGSTVVNGTITVLNAFKTLEADLDGNSHAIWNFRNGGSAVNLAVAGGATEPFPAYVIPDLPHAVKTYCATFGFRCGMYQDADHRINGEMDFQIGISIVTDAGGVATCTLDTVPVPNVSYLPAGLAGATFAVTATAGGFTVSVTAPSATNCHAWYDFWVQRYRDVT